MTSRDAGTSQRGDCRILLKSKHISSSTQCLTSVLPLEMFLLCCLDKENTPCPGKLNFCPYQQHLRYVSVKARQGSFWWALQSQYCSSLASRHQQKWKGRKGSPSDFLQLQITTFFSIQKFYKYQCAFAKIVAAWKSVSIAMHDIKR